MGVLQQFQQSSLSYLFGSLPWDLIKDANSDKCFKGPSCIAVTESTATILCHISRWCCVSDTNLINPIPPWGGGGKCPHRLQLLRTSLIFEQYLPNVATFTKIYWGTRFWKSFASTASHVAMATTFSTPCLLKF